MPVDDRIVSMKFDNKEFASKIAETLAGLDKLKKSLDMAGSTRSVEDLAAAGRNFNMGNMAGAVEGVSLKFAALATIGITTLVNLTNRAIDAGLAFSRSLTVAPIAQGWGEFELKMGSIQTIMSGSGEGLGIVNQKLQELNEYSDKTIYSFKDMTSNIGKFTNAGVSLDKSVAAIQGVANVAALSGATSEEASRAMYNFSQALAAGSVKAIDWRSIELANMGTVEFKQQLIDSAEAMGTLTKRGDEWVTSSGTVVTATKGFRDSLSEDWLTSEALTETLARFSDETTDVGKRATAAATEVKTFSMMIDTMKESVGSGWAKTFELIFGDFEEGKKLWTSINDAFSDTVGKSAEARNHMIEDWKDRGGRDVLLQGLEDGVYSLARALSPIKEAFRDIFPPMTGKRLFEMTKIFATFTRSLDVSRETMGKIRDTFRGLFSVVEIGWTIFKGILGVIGQVLSSFSGAGSGLLDFGANAGNMLTRLNEALVAGGGIARFFDKVSNAILNAISFVKEFAGNASDGIETALGRIQGRFDSLNRGATIAAEKVGGAWNKVQEVLADFDVVLSEIWAGVSGFFTDLGRKLAEQLDFDPVLDVVNVGLVGGIFMLLKKFLSGGIDINVGGGVMDKIKEALDGVTGTLAAMQAKVKGELLMKIAVAVGVLAASMLVLSMIDSGDLTKALIAMSVGFGQLVGVMTLLTLLTAGPMGAAKIAGLSAGLILLASAMLLLSVAIKNLSSLGWGELAKGLIGVGAGLAIMIVALSYIPPAEGMIRAGIAMGIISAALWVLSKAVQSFGQMPAATIAKGLGGIAGALGVMIIAMHAMPTESLISAGIAIGIVSASLLVLAKAVESFASINAMDTMKGLAGIAGTLGILALAMWAMPPGMIATAAGLLILSGALVVISGVMRVMAGMDVLEIAKGIGALAGVLGVLAIAMMAMTGTAAGAAAMLVASVALTAITAVLWGLGKLGIGQIVGALTALAGVFVILGGAAFVLQPLLPALFGLGAALTLIGAGFALFGVGANLVAKAFEAMARAGKAGVAALIGSLELLITAAPRFITALVNSLIDFAAELMRATPMLMGLFGVMLESLLNLIITKVPLLAQALSVIITEGLRLIREKFPEILTTGAMLLLTLLAGLQSVAPRIVTELVTLIVTVAGALVANSFRLVDAGVRLMVAFLQAIQSRVNTIVTAGTNLLIALVTAIANQIHRVIDVAANIIISFIREIGNRAGDIVRAGADALIDFVEGIGNEINRVITAAVDVAIAFVTQLSNEAIRFANAAAQVLTDFLNGIADAIRNNTQQLRDAGINIASAIISGMTGGISDMAGDFLGEVAGLASRGLEAISGVFETRSPSKAAFRIAQSIPQGMALALEKDRTAENSVVDHAERILRAFQETLNKAPDDISGMDEFGPVITPVLDLTKVRSESRNLDRLLAASAITADVSYGRARTISTTSEVEPPASEPVVQAGPTEIKFEQNNYSPTPLSTNDVYRNTKSQIALAKKELNIP